MTLADPQPPPLQEQVMRSFIVFAAILLAFVMLGCGASGRYPDSTPETRAKADAARNQAKVDSDRVDSELAEAVNALDFRANQIKEKARQEREASALKRDKAVQPLVARQQEARAEAEREKQRAHEDDAKLAKDATPDQVAASRAEAKRRADEAARKAEATVADAEAAIAKADADARQEKIDINERETKGLAEIEAKRVEAKNHARERHLAIDADLANRLSELEKEAARAKDANASAGH
jgi:hypothetical protein